MLCSTVYITAGNMSPETGKKTPLLHKGLLLDLCSLKAGAGVLYHRLTVAARVCIPALLLIILVSSNVNLSIHYMLIVFLVEEIHVRHQKDKGKFTHK